ncbi:MAG: LPS biosynthesis protein WbpP [Flammeovirgaceae bacterium]|nr:LPS biosynthesis protein WbpP [Flammeovirgaceae bacterium]MBE62781.1 LPS biosynthesis protein WbpP [Flammeovirgaceae bacterium]
MGKRIIVTGGAGFIGSNLVEALLADERVDKVLVIDNLSNGYFSNIEEFEGHRNFEFVNEDIRNAAKLVELFKGYDLVSHQAALGSVPRSIQDPITSNEVNVGGTLNVLNAAVKNNIKRVVLAFSSSTYGDSPILPKVEHTIGKPLSPYAVTKYACEVYADVFQKVYGLDFIGLRYFNVFGPKQNPDNPYAAVIPLFCKSLLAGQQPKVNGDGETSRDFTYIANAIDANVKSLFSDNKNALNEVYNVACGERTSLNELVNYINQYLGADISAIHGPERPGDVKHSLADISKAISLLNYNPSIKVIDGLKNVIDWYRSTEISNN